MLTSGALSERMCSPSVNKQKPFHVLRAQKDLRRLKTLKQNSVESVGHFYSQCSPALALFLPDVSQEM